VILTEVEDRKEKGPGQLRRPGPSLSRSNPSRWLGFQSIQQVFNTDRFWGSASRSDFARYL